MVIILMRRICSVLDNDIINQNKEVYLELLSGIEREGFFKEQLLSLLNNSDFFTAPASTKYHSAYPGGLCEHSLDVYKELKMLSNKFPQYFYTEDTIRIVSLLHDISKVNLYKKDIRNKKVYHEAGSKTDNLGRFDWVSEEAYSVDNENKFIFGNHEQTSEFIVRQYMPLFVEESVALLHHHGGMGWDSTRVDITRIFNKYPLALMLHTADMLATYLDQNE